MNQYRDADTKEVFWGCPNCETDEYLTDEVYSSEDFERTLGTILAILFIGIMALIAYYLGMFLANLQ